MKRISFFLVLALILFSFGLANAERSINISGVSTGFNDMVLGPTTGGECVSVDARAEFLLHITNDESPECFFLPSMGYEISTPGSATWTWDDPGNADLALYGYELLFVDTLCYDIPVVGVVCTDQEVYFDRGGNSVNDKPDHNAHKIFDAIYRGFEFNGTAGEGTDIVGFAGVVNNPLGLYYGIDNDALAIALTPHGEGEVICIDITDAFSGFEWGWSPLAVDYATAPCNVGDQIPDWGGPYCYTIVTPPDMPPEFDDCTDVDHNPTTIEGSHCATLTGSFCAVDPDPGQGPSPDDVTYSASFGTIVDGDWQGGPWNIGDVGTSITLIVYAHEADNPLYDSLLVNINLTNEAPTFTSCPTALNIVGVGVTASVAVAAEDICSGDPMTFFIVEPIEPGAVMNGSNLEFTPAAAGSFSIEVGVTDGVDSTVGCFINFDAIIGSQYEVKIQKTHDTPQGQFESVAVTMEAQAEPIGGFNFLIAYDASALTFQGADVEDAFLYTDCAWEYFTYRYGPFGNCGNACPSGLLRVVGIGETNNGPIHPICYEGPDGYTLFNLNFLVSNDRVLECMYVPIRFFWIECGDNTISSEDGTRLFINDVVKDFDFEGTGITDIADFDGTMPTYLGAPDECVTVVYYPGTDSVKNAVERAIGFTNGGIDIVCAKDIDDRGDINLNGLAYEIADAVMFSNYFIDGLGAFVDGSEDGSIAATDVNADGLTLSVADLVYLIRVIVGDALPYDDPFLKPSNANVSYNNGVVSVDGEMGAAAFVFSGEVNVELIAPNMELKSRFDGVNTNAVVYSTAGNTFTGDIVRGNGNLVSLELGSAYGGTVVATMMPSDFALNQNYPNPFNPVTNVTFALPTAETVTFTLYNIAGQVVSTTTNDFVAGEHKIEVDGSAFSSGIYFYRLDAGSFTDTKKMVLLK